MKVAKRYKLAALEALPVTVTMWTLSKALSISWQVVDLWMRTKDLPYISRGNGHRLILKSDLIDWMRGTGRILEENPIRHLVKKKNKTKQ